MPTTISGTGGVSQCAPNSVSQDDLQTGVTSKGPVFRAAQASSQAAVTSVTAKIVMATENFDTGACYDTANSRFTPNVAGYYRFSGVVRANCTTLSQFFVYLYKNGAQQISVGNNTTAAIQHLNVTDLVFMNGTTDYMELWGQLSGTGLSFERFSDASCASFCGELVRAA